MKDCGRLEEYRTGSFMMIGISCATIVVLILVTGTLIYQRHKKLRRTRQLRLETPQPNTERSCYLKTEMDIIELDILNSNTIIVGGGGDPITGCLMEDFDEAVEVVQTKETKADIYFINNNKTFNGSITVS